MSKEEITGSLGTVVASSVQNLGEGLLFGMWQHILEQKKIDTPALGKLIDEFVEKLPGLEEKDMIPLRGNLRKELCSGPMSLKVFNKGLLVIKAELATFTVQVYDQGLLSVTSAVASVDFRNPDIQPAQ